MNGPSSERSGTNRVCADLIAPAGVYTRLEPKVTLTHGYYSFLNKLWTQNTAKSHKAYITKH